MTRGQQPNPPSIDGIPRGADEEERINATCRAALNGPGGQDLMEYLISITLMAVMPPGTSDNELREKEGQRRLVGILDARRKSKPRQKTNQGHPR